jgi:hypothetical protein
MTLPELFDATRDMLEMGNRSIAAIEKTAERIQRGLNSLFVKPSTTSPSHDVDMVLELAILRQIVGQELAVGNSILIDKAGKAAHPLRFEVESETETYVRFRRIR